tara:strand:+ start:119 stop:334 length:216 start_codon:yes stop_codon:yes gene_type:complete
MGKLIIKNQSSLSDRDAMRIVGRVIEEGRMSDDGKAYCYLSIYNLLPNKVAVSARLNKSSDTFTLWDYPNK